MNITQETEDYYTFPQTDNKTPFQKYCKQQKYEAENKGINLAEEILKDKLKTTPSARLTMIGKSFRIKDVIHLFKKR